MATAATPTGLTQREVDERIRDGRVNAVPDAPTRTTRQIVRANVVTPVNGIIGVMFVLIMIAAPGPDALFAGVVISNSVIGIVQELRAKKELDALAVLNAPRARVVREGIETEIGISGVVADDVLAIGPGDQIVVDGEVIVAQGLEANEALLTGESEPVLKQLGDEVMSGSFVAAGSGHYRATRIGAESYAASLAEEARRFQLAHSELRTGINQILRWLMYIIPPVAILLLASLLSSEDDWRHALQGTVAACVAMVPDGLVLLTSIAFIVGVLSLARRKALAKELASVELLARVDTLCLDKTGTITTGEIAFGSIEALPRDEGPLDEAHVTMALAALAASDANPNATLAAIGTAVGDSDWTAGTVVPFSSARKWSGASFAEHGTWCIGAPEMILDGSPGVDDERRAACLAAVARGADAGQRVVMVARGAVAFADDGAEPTLPSDIDPVALVLLEDEIRPDADEILAYFTQQGITLKVISGDHPSTVAAVAARAGIRELGVATDARDLPDDDDELADLLDRTTVFGRVTPHQKRTMVAALQRRGHVVAMTGDGVNDVLALKDADMGIAMGSGSASARAVAQLVLLDNSFATLPVVLAEGRRVINNIERVANLFVTKAAYAVLLAALAGVLRDPFPFLPRHLTLVGTFSIGVPGFFLALEPNVRRAETGFIARVVRFSVPSGIVAGLATWVAFSLARRSDGTSLDEARTIATCVLVSLGIYVLGMLCRPFNAYRLGLLGAMIAGFVTALKWGPVQEFFALDVPDVGTWGASVACVVVAALILELAPRVIPWWNAPARTTTVEPPPDLDADPSVPSSSLQD
jgi:cation-transporting P-type ATPase E